MNILLTLIAIFLLWNGIHSLHDYVRMIDKKIDIIANANGVTFTKQSTTNEFEVIAVDKFGNEIAVNNTVTDTQKELTK